MHRATALLRCGCHTSLRIGGWRGGRGQVVGRGCRFQLVNTQHPSAPLIDDLILLLLLLLLLLLPLLLLLAQYSRGLSIEY